jgi:hypothetical protein
MSVQSAEDIGFDPKLWIDLMEVLSDTDLNSEALRYPPNLLHLLLQFLQQGDEMYLNGFVFMTTTLEGPPAMRSPGARGRRGVGLALNPGLRWRHAHDCGHNVWIVAEAKDIEVHVSIRPHTLVQLTLPVSDRPLWAGPLDEVVGRLHNAQPGTVPPKTSSSFDRESVAVCSVTSAT